SVPRNERTRSSPETNGPARSSNGVVVASELIAPPRARLASSATPATASKISEVIGPPFTERRGRARSPPTGRTRTTRTLATTLVRPSPNRTASGARTLPVGNGVELREVHVVSPARARPHRARIILASRPRARRLFEAAPVPKIA